MISIESRGFRPPRMVDQERRSFCAFMNFCGFVDFCGFIDSPETGQTRGFLFERADVGNVLEKGAPIYKRKLALQDAALLKRRKKYMHVRCPTPPDICLQSKHDIEKVRERKFDRSPTGYKQQNNLNRFEDGYRDVDIGRNTKREDADNAEQRHNDFCEPHH